MYDIQFYLILMPLFFNNLFNEPADSGFQNWNKNKNKIALDI